jgi:hypothetical protein
LRHKVLAWKRDAVHDGWHFRVPTPRQPRLRLP